MQPVSRASCRSGGPEADRRLWWERISMERKIEDGPIRYFRVVRSWTTKPSWHKVVSAGAPWFSTNRRSPPVPASQILSLWPRSPRRRGRPPRRLRLPCSLSPKPLLRTLYGPLATVLVHDCTLQPVLSNFSRDYGPYKVHQETKIYPRLWLNIEKRRVSPPLRPCFAVLIRLPGSAWALTTAAP